MLFLFILFYHTISFEILKTISYLNVFNVHCNSQCNISLKIVIKQSLLKNNGLCIGLLIHGITKIYGFKMHSKITYIDHTLKQIFAFFQKGKTNLITLYTDGYLMI